jgi:hypothetical protein
MNPTVKPTTPTAPPGGFQQGGWYGGQQYWNGQLGSPGVITNPGQQGFGQPVSKETVAQTNPANVAYLQTQGATLPSAGTPTPAGVGTGVGGMPAPATIDLVGLNKSLSESAGIPAIEQKITDAGNAYKENLSKINDNPYLSEADRTGRAEKLRIDYNNDIKNVNETLAMKKADIETQINLQAKQFDINSQAAKTAFDQFNSLLSSGALDNASGIDIASITRATGISSSMIQSAISAAKTKDAKMIQYDDGKNQGVAIIDANGNIIKKSVISTSKPKANEPTVNSQVIEATAVISDYIRDKKAQVAASPEDFIAKLILAYPLATETLMTAKDIRNITGQ